MLTDLNISQLRAIKKSAYLGKILQKDLPEIAEDYKKGLSKSKIIKKYNIKETYKIGENVAQNAVTLALRGYSGHLGIKSYLGLIKNESELEKLASEHQAIAFNSLTPEQRKANGKKAYEQGLGVYGYITEKRKEIGRKGGIKARDNNLGFHSTSKKQKSLWGTKAIIASGKTPYTLEEKERIFELADDPNYQNGKKGPSYKKIANQINQEFHNNKHIRTNHSINYVLFRG